MKIITHFLALLLLVLISFNKVYGQYKTTLLKDTIYNGAVPIHDNIIIYNAD